MIDVGTYSERYFASGAAPSDGFTFTGALKNCADKATSAIDVTYIGHLHRVSTDQNFDFSDIVVQEIKSEHGTLRRREPLVLRPFFSESGELYQLEVNELGISIVAYTRGELVDAVHDFLVVLWDEYALEDDCNLTENARDLKNRMLKDFRVI